MNIKNYIKLDQVFTKKELQNFSVSIFEEIDKQISKTKDEECREHINTLNDFIEDFDNGVYCNYLMAALSLKTRPHEENIYMQNIMLYFYDNQNISVTTFLADKILKHNENKFALRIIAEEYNKKHDEINKIAYYERLVAVDSKEVKICKYLAEHFLALRDNAKSSKYYKKLLFRYINQQLDYPSIISAWERLLNLNTENDGYFLSLIEKMSNKYDKSQINALFESLIAHNTDIDVLISYYKLQLENYKFDITSHEANNIKKTIISAYKEKYKDYPRLKQCLHRANILSKEAIRGIDYFEKNIEFSPKSYVFHTANEKIGILKSINDKVVEVSFGKTITKMDTELAYNALVHLPKTHIIVLANAIPEKLALKIKGDARWTLNNILTSYDNKCSLRDIKPILVDKVLTEKEWEAFKKEAKKVAADDPYISSDINDAESFILSKTPMSPEEKKLIQFNSETTIYNKIKVVRDFINSKYDTESDSFALMIEYFNQLFSAPVITDAQLTAYLFLNNLKSVDKIATVSIDSKLSFYEMNKTIKNKPEVFSKMSLPEIKKAYIKEIQLTEYSWANILKNLFPYYISSEIVNVLKNNKKGNVYIDMLKECVVKYKTQQDIFLWNYRNADIKDWIKAEFDSQSLILVLLSLLSYTNSLLENKLETVENRRRLDTIVKILFVNQELAKAIKEGDQAFAKKVYTLVYFDKNKDLGHEIEVKDAILSKFKDFDFMDNDVVIDTLNFIPQGFLCTKAFFDQKVEEIEHLESVELVNVANEIAEARAHGDLKENAEYQYAKDKQRNLLARLGTIGEELQSAQIITADTVDNTKISFGTKVCLLDNNNGNKIEYSILGQWESDPNNNVINFKTPLANALLNKKVDEIVKFTINETNYDYKVISIETLDF